MKFISFYIIGLILITGIFNSCTSKVHILPNNEIYTCKFRVHVLDDHPAKCPIDTSVLIKLKITEEQRQMLENGGYVSGRE